MKTNRSIKIIKLATSEINETISPEVIKQIKKLIITGINKVVKLPKSVVSDIADFVIANRTTWKPSLPKYFNIPKESLPELEKIISSSFQAV